MTEDGPMLYVHVKNGVAQTILRCCYEYPEYEWGLRKENDGRYSYGNDFYNEVGWGRPQPFAEIVREHPGLVRAEKIFQLTDVVPNDPRIAEILGHDEFEITTV